METSERVKVLYHAVLCGCLGIRKTTEPVSSTKAFLCARNLYTHSQHIKHTQRERERHTHIYIYMHVKKALWYVYVTVMS